jgi:putative phosphoesterase
MLLYYGKIIIVHKGQFLEDVKNSILLVLSDTHGNMAALTAVLRWAMENRMADHLAFLGDGARDIRQAVARTGFSAPCTAVRGNGDFENLPPSDVLEFAGHRFFLTHGHLYRVHNGYDTLISSAAAMEAEAALFGHTHVPLKKEAGTMLLLNPGSLGRPRSSAGPAFAVVECPPGNGLVVRFWGLRDTPRGVIVVEVDM